MTESLMQAIEAIAARAPVSLDLTDEDQLEEVQETALARAGGHRGYPVRVQGIWC